MISLPNSYLFIASHLSDSTLVKLPDSYSRSLDSPTKGKQKAIASMDLDSSPVMGGIQLEHSEGEELEIIQTWENIGPVYDAWIRSEGAQASFQSLNIFQA
jgi:hypothetical protein